MLHLVELQERPDVQLKNLVLSSTRHLDTFFNLVLGLIFNLLLHTNLWSTLTLSKLVLRRAALGVSAFGVDLISSLLRAVFASISEPETRSKAEIKHFSVPSCHFA
jgi:hypothetical protein